MAAARDLEGASIGRGEPPRESPVVEMARDLDARVEGVAAGIDLAREQECVGVDGGGECRVVATGALRAEERQLGQREEAVRIALRRETLAQLRERRVGVFVERLAQVQSREQLAGGGARAVARHCVLGELALDFARADPVDANGRRAGDRHCEERDQCDLLCSVPRIPPRPSSDLGVAHPAPRAGTSCDPLPGSITPRRHDGEDPDPRERRTPARVRRRIARRPDPGAACFPAASLGAARRRRGRSRSSQRAAGARRSTSGPPSSRPAWRSWPRPSRARRPSSRPAASTSTRSARRSPRCGSAWVRSKPWPAPIPRRRPPPRKPLRVTDRRLRRSPRATSRRDPAPTLNFRRVPPMTRRAARPPGPSCGDRDVQEPCRHPLQRPRHRPRNRQHPRLRAQQGPRVLGAERRRGRLRLARPRRARARGRLRSEGDARPHAERHPRGATDQGRRDRRLRSHRGDAALLHPEGAQPLASWCARAS